MKHDFFFGFIIQGDKRVLFSGFRFLIKSSHGIHITWFLFPQWSVKIGEVVVSTPVIASIDNDAELEVYAKLKIVMG